MHIVRVEFWECLEEVSDVKSISSKGVEVYEGNEVGGYIVDVECSGVVLLVEVGEEEVRAGEG